MSRTKALQSFTWSGTKKLLAERGVELISAGLDEVPGVYKDKKDARLPHEAGLRLQRKPTMPRALPATLLIQNLHSISDWQRFLVIQ